jgi:hypothetical protein
VDEQRIVRAAADFLLERQRASPRSQAPSTGESPAETCRRATAASNPRRQTRFSCSKRGWTAATCASGQPRQHPRPPETALLRWLIGAQADATPKVDSDGRHEFGECRGHPQQADCMVGEFVVAAGQVTGWL